MGQVDENGEKVLNDDGTVVDEDFYYITFEIDGKSVLSDTEKATFCVSDLTEKAVVINEKIIPYCEINSVNVIPESYFVKAKVNRLTDEIEYMAADEEDGYILATATEPLDKDGKFVRKDMSFELLRDGELVQLLIYEGEEPHYTNINVIEALGNNKYSYKIKVKNSSNTKKLYDLSLNYCKDTFIIETVNDLNKDFSIYNKVGIMAGASTPKESITEVIDYLNS